MSERVRVKATAGGSDASFGGREGIIKHFDPSLGWTSARALLAPEKFVCVHFLPKGKRELRDGSPMALIDESNLERLSNKQSANEMKGPV
jgi:hypothetical protein